MLSAPLLKCSEPWNWLLWHFKQSHTTQVSGPDSPKQWGMGYVSHFWFVCPHWACVALQGRVGSQVCCPAHPPGTHFPQPWRVPLGEVSDGLLGAWPFRNFMLLPSFWPWSGGGSSPSPPTHHGFGFWSPRRCPHLPHTPRASLHLHGNKSLPFYLHSPNLTVHTLRRTTLCRVNLCCY